MTTVVRRSPPALWGRLLAGGAIRLYQRYVSPRKGYVCAYGRLHGRRSCSDHVLHRVEVLGVWAALRRLPSRFRACGRASNELRAMHALSAAGGADHPSAPEGRADEKGAVPEGCNESAHTCYVGCEALSIPAACCSSWR